MKKVWLFVLALFVLTSLAFLISNVSAELISTNPDNITIAGKTPEEIVTIGDQVTDPNTGPQYLKQEWAKILEKSGFGRFLLKISNVFTYLNFFWRPVLGIEYSFSWYFIFAIAIWIILFCLIYGPMGALFDNPLFGAIGGFVIASLIGMSGVIKKAVDMLAFVVSNKWIAMVSLVIAIFIAMLIMALSGGLKEYLNKQKEAAEKEKTDKARKIIQTHGRVSEKELKSYSED